MATSVHSLLVNSENYLSVSDVGRRLVKTVALPLELDANHSKGLVDVFLDFVGLVCGKDDWGRSIRAAWTCVSRQGQVRHQVQIASQSSGPCCCSINHMPST
jgi:hypothetical protein